MSESSADAPSSPPPLTPPPPTSPPKRQPVSVRGIIGLVALAGCLAAIVALLFAEPPAWGLRIGSAGAALFAGWLLTWGRQWTAQLGGAIGLGTAAALAFSLEWAVPGWPCAGGATGCAGAWAYGQRGRARAASIALVVTAYAVVAGTGLLEALRGDATWWLMGQGVVSLALGALALRLGHIAPPPNPEQDSPDSPSNSTDLAHTRWQTVGRILILWGILLPYLGLMLHALGLSLRG